MLAIVRSGRLGRKAALDTEVVVGMFQQLQGLSTKKSYLAELCCQVERSLLEEVWGVVVAASSPRVVNTLPRWNGERSSAISCHCCYPT